MTIKFPCILYCSYIQGRGRFIIDKEIKQEVVKDVSTGHFFNKTERVFYKNLDCNHATFRYIYRIKSTLFISRPLPNWPIYGYDLYWSESALLGYGSFTNALIFSTMNYTKFLTLMFS